MPSVLAYLLKGNPKVKAVDARLAELVRARLGQNAEVVIRDAFKIERRRVPGAGAVPGQVSAGLGVTNQHSRFRHRYYEEEGKKRPHGPPGQGSSSSPEWWSQQRRHDHVFRKLAARRVAAFVISPALALLVALIPKPLRQRQGKSYCAVAVRCGASRIGQQYLVAEGAKFAESLLAGSSLFCRVVVTASPW